MHADQAPGESSVKLCARCTMLRLHSVRIAFLPAYVVKARDQVGGKAHRHKIRGVIKTGLIGQNANPRHRLHTASEDDLVLTSHYLHGSDIAGVEARCAIAIDCHPGNACRKTGMQCRGFCNVATLFANLGDTAENHVANGGRVQRIARQHRIHK